MQTVPPSSDVTTGTWTLNANGADASVNSSDGTITVNSLPATDIVMTLSCNVTASGITKTATKEILLQGTTVAAPTLTRSGNSVTLETATIGATIYYTTDGSTPSSSSAVYSGPIDIAGLSFPVTVKAIAIRSGNSSDPASATYSQPACEVPVITVGSGGVVTITCATEGATIRITYGDSPADPTGSSPVFTSLTLSQGQVVKAIATKSGYDNSAVAMAEYVQSGVSGGIVTLDDREDHNWSYYQTHGGIDASYGYPDALCSPYPRNVKITYYGYGSNTLSLSETAAPAANTFTTSTTSSDVKVGIGEEGHTFVYYKTLERDANNRFPYELIPNPFSVRPKSGSTYTGFYKWRVKSVSGGSICNAGGTALATASTASSNNVWLDAEQTYYFQPTDNGQTNANNATSMTVELEALWAPAEISTGNSPSFSNGYNSVERNFYVGSGTILTGSTPCTYSSFYPNGTDGSAAATVAANGTVNNRLSKASGTAGADCKVEYIIWSNTTALNTGGHKVTIGRGMTASGNGPSLNPLSGTFNNDADARLRIESGTYNGGTSNLYGTPSVGSHLVHLDLILGSDYDRANGDNSKLVMASSNTIQHGAHTATGSSWLSFQHLDITVKSGKMQENYWNQNSATYTYTFYCRSTLSDANQYPGITYLTVEGGEFASINGGRGNYQENLALADDIVFSLRIKGGTVHGSIYGAASANPSFGGRRVVMTGGMVEGWIAGGCDGTNNGGGATVGDSYFYIGGNAKVGNTGNTGRTLDGTLGGNVFGAGRGMNNHGTSANPASMRNAYIAVADNGFVLRSVYGGGDYGYTGVIDGDGNTSSTTAANFYILGGTVSESVFGGGNNNNSACTNSNIVMTGGLVKRGVYGGSNSSGTMDYNVTIQIDGGTVGDGTSEDGVYGGGYGSATSVAGNVSVTLGASTAATDSATVNGNVYGGSALGSVNTNTSNTTVVTMHKGLVNGNLFGGALGQASPLIAAPVNGLITVNIRGGRVNGSVFGGGDVAPYGRNGQNYPVVNMTGGTVTDLYGGGKGATAAVTGNPQVNLSGKARVTHNVYGGGDQAAVTGNPNVILR